MFRKHILFFSILEISIERETELWIFQKYLLLFKVSMIKKLFFFPEFHGVTSSHLLCPKWEMYASGVFSGGVFIVILFGLSSPRFLNFTKLISTSKFIPWAAREGVVCWVELCVACFTVLPTSGKEMVICEDYSFIVAVFYFVSKDLISALYFSMQ